MTVHINIGSNLGEREATLRRATELIIRALPGDVLVSQPFESPAWGYESDKTYLNTGISITLDVSHHPHDILHILQSIERSIDSRPHRDDTGAYIDRMIDIDLIAVDDMVMDTPELTLPHPRMHLREFVLVPLSQTAPEWLHPTLKLTPSALIAALHSRQDNKV